MSPPSRAIAHRKKLPPVKLSVVLLAGGRATRMGGTDKGLINFRGAPLAAVICDALAAQTSEIIINANRNQDRYRELGHKVIADQLTGHQGPLAGMHAALVAAHYEWLLTIPCDGPNVADDYADKMLRTATEQQVKLVVAHDGARSQPVYCLIHRDLADSLEKFLARDERKIDKWHAEHPFAFADFSDNAEMFININTPEQLAAAEK